MLRNRQFIDLYHIKESGQRIQPADGKEPAGYVKLEIRKNNGKMQLYIQDKMGKAPKGHI